jgi:hypothetical protein
MDFFKKPISTSEDVKNGEHEFTKHTFMKRPETEIEKKAKILREKKSRKEITEDEYLDELEKLRQPTENEKIELNKKIGNIHNNTKMKKM